MIDRAGHKTIANIRGRSIQRTRILLTHQVDSSYLVVSAVAATTVIAHGSAQTEPCAIVPLGGGSFRQAGVQV